MGQFRLCILKRLLVTTMKELYYSLFELYKCLVVGLMILLPTYVCVIIYQMICDDVIYLHYNKIENILMISNIAIIGASHYILYFTLFESDIEEEYINWVKKHNTMPYVIMTLGIYNTYLLDLFYKINVFTKSDLLFQPIPGRFSISTPIINVYIYIRIVRKIRDKGYDIETWQIIRLYLIGQLATYLVRNYKYTELDVQLEYIVK